MDDVLSEVARESGEPERPAGDPEVPVGEHVRAFRENRGMTVQQFAERTGFSAALLTQIENRMVSPSLGTLVKIANTFGTTVSSFIGGKEEREFSIVRKEDRTTVSLVRLQPLSESPTARSAHDGEEFLYVLSGKVTVCLGNLSDVLEEGDSVYYNSTIPHHVHSADEREALILAVIHAGA